MSFIHEVYVSCDFVFTVLQLSVMPATWHMFEHFFGLICEGRREPCLLGLPLDLRPLGQFYGVFDAVWAWTRSILLRNDPSWALLGLRFDNVSCIGLRLGPFQVRIVVLGWRYLQRQPFLMLSKVHSIVLAVQRIKHAVSWGNRYNRRLTISSCLEFLWAFSFVLCYQTC